ncbi:BA14K family protein [Rhizobium sp. TRM95111]|uniref:BA14K family protein n=1 Tax=Rhizobium alarense TaxID=2846851 RepID=UPI001F1CDF83|nr:BA14K family protein [Rhizobium alarense]MCF3640751.1 BA14K family protein [Rhizobium alarense]
MNTIAKTLVLTAAVAATVLSSIGAADARDRYRRHHNHGDAWAAGAVGLATGMIIGGAIANSGSRYYEPPPRRVYVEPEYYPVRRVYREPIVVNSLEPWSPAWYDYCSARYRSFNSQSGTYIGYDGLQHFCTAG